MQLLPPAGVFPVVKTMQNKIGSRSRGAEPFDWGGLALVAMLIGAMLTFCGLLRFLPAFNGMTEAFHAEPLLTGKQTLALGVALLAGGAVLFVRCAKLPAQRRK